MKLLIKVMLLEKEDLLEVCLSDVGCYETVFEECDVLLTHRLANLLRLELIKPSRDVITLVHF